MSQKISLWDNPMVRDAIKRMTPEEIAQAENLAKEWLKIRSQE